MFVKRIFAESFQSNAVYFVYYDSWKYIAVLQLCLIFFFQTRYASSNKKGEESMSKTQTYSMEKVLAAQEALRNLPAKEREQSRAEVVEFLKADLRKAVKQGHSLKDIQAILAEQGISVSLAGMEAVLGKPGKGAVRQRADSGQPSPSVKAGTATPLETTPEKVTVKPATQNPILARQEEDKDTPASYRDDLPDSEL